MSRYEDLLIAEAAGKLPATMQRDLDLVRAAGAVPALEPWPMSHPHIQAAEDRYGIPRGALGALMMTESSGDPQVRGTPAAGSSVGLFQVTKRTGAPYGLTPTNRTNPYLETDVAARHFAELLQQSGSLEDALVRWNGGGIDPHTYLNHFRKFYQQAQQPAPVRAAPAKAAPATARATPVEATTARATTTTQPAATTTTTAPRATTTTTQPPPMSILERAGFGQPYARGPAGLLGQTLENFDTGPMGPLVKMLELPAATVGRGVEGVTGSSGAGTAAQIATDLLLPKAVPKVVGRLPGGAMIAPRSAAKAALPRTLRAVDEARRATETALAQRPAITQELLQGVRTLRRRQASLTDPALAQHVERGIAALSGATPERAIRILDDLATLTGGRIPAVTRAMAAAEEYLRAPSLARSARRLESEVARLQKVAGSPGGVSRLLRPVLHPIRSLRGR